MNVSKQRRLLRGRKAELRMGPLLIGGTIGMLGGFVWEITVHSKLIVTQLSALGGIVIGAAIEWLTYRHLQHKRRRDRHGVGH